MLGINVQPFLKVHNGLASSMQLVLESPLSSPPAFAAASNPPADPPDAPGQRNSGPNKRSVVGVAGNGSGQSLSWCFVISG